MVNSECVISALSCAFITQSTEQAPTCILLIRLMAPSGPCSRGMPSAEVWTGGRRMEPAPTPNMFWRPVRAESSPATRAQRCSKKICHQTPTTSSFIVTREQEKLGKDSPNTAGLSKVGSNCWRMVLSLPWRDRGMRVSTPASDTCRGKVCLHYCIAFDALHPSFS